MPGEVEQLDPLKLLQEDLKDDDDEQAIVSIKRLHTIALALGPDRTRNELVPFLAEYVEQDKDEALTAIATQLGDFSESVGGSTYIPVLIPLLEKLSGEEECVVRDAAVKSLAKLIPQCQKPDVATKVCPLIKRLANGDWFTTRVSACGLFPPAYPLIPEPAQDELRALFTTLCNDDTPMVRKAAYRNLGDFASQVQKQYFKTDIVPILKAISNDDSDAMRIFAIEASTILTGRIDLSESVATILPLLEQLQDDSSWRVRKSFCNNCAIICKNLGEATASKRVLPLFARLLKDREGEVRQVAAGVMADVCDECKSGVVDYIVPCLEALSTDAVGAVRVQFAKSFVRLAEPLGKEMAAKILTPLVLQLCKDETAEVRNYVVSNVDLIADAVGPAGLQNSVLPALLELCKDSKWRVRLAVVGKCAMLAKHLGVKVFEKKLQPVIVTALSDHVYSIREKCCQQIGEIVALFGKKWAAEKFFPVTFAIYDKTTNYLHRMTCLLVVQACAQACAPDVTEANLFPLIVQACTDDVPNVRLMAAKTCKVVLKYLEPATIAKIKPALEKMTKDTDDDVAFFSCDALKLIK